MLAEQFPQEPLQEAAKGAGRAVKRQQCLSAGGASFAAVPRAASERPSRPVTRTLRRQHPQAWSKKATYFNTRHSGFIPVKLIPTMRSKVKSGVPEVFQYAAI